MPKRIKAKDEVMKPKPVRAWAVCDIEDGSIITLYACDHPHYAMRKYMGEYLTRGTTRDEMLEEWDRAYAPLRQVVEYRCTPVTPKRKARP